MTPKTELSRDQIADLFKISKTKLIHIMDDATYRFPKPVKTIAHGAKMYNQAAVLKWRESHDPVRITIKSSKPSKRKEKPQAEKPAAAFVMKIGHPKKPKFKRTGTSVTVHVLEHHDYPEPRQYPTGCGHSGADHRSHYIGNRAE